MFKKLIYRYNLWRNRKMFLKVHRMYLKAGFANPLDRTIDFLNYFIDNLGCKNINKINEKTNL